MVVGRLHPRSPWEIKGEIMKKTLLAALIFAASMAANAACVGSGSFQKCTDNSGNTYNVQRNGNTTTVQGYNSNTGSNWSQNSYTNGNTTNTYGTAANGSQWNATTINNGNSSTTFGTDSNGKSFNKTCGPMGCF